MYITRPFNIQLDTVFHNRIFALNLKRKLKERWRKNDKKVVKRASSIFLYKSYGSLDRKLCKEENDLFLENHVASLFLFFEKVQVICELRF